MANDSDDYRVVLTVYKGNSLINAKYFANKDYALTMKLLSRWSGEASLHKAPVTEKHEDAG